MQQLSSHATVTVRLRSIVWFAGGLSCALIAVIGFAAARSAALPGAEESTFVPITPCRLFDTRTESGFNVGPRDTLIGPGETHQQPVTGTHGNCSVPVDATGVALNVTAIDPTADSFLTLYPFDAALPETSNLNYLVGSAPTPNKVDVRLSADGELGIYNAFPGRVDVLADVTGYYTAAGLQDLVAELAGKANLDDVYTQAQTDAALETKADLDDVYTQAQTDAALETKAHLDDVYTKVEIEARTQMRSISFPIESLRLSDPPGLSLEPDGVWWADDAAAAANLSIRRPADWTGDSAVTLEIAFERTPDDGPVSFRVTPQGFSDGDDTSLAAFAIDTPTQTAVGQNVMRQAAVSIADSFLAGDWWQISIRRVTGLPLGYADPLFVTAVSLTYEAHT